MSPDVPKKGSSKSKRSRKKRPPRPDELSRDTFEFISAVDEFKRSEMRSFLQLEEILEILEGLGYARRDGTTEAEVEALTEALEEYKREHERLFPNWSEIFSVLVQMGYRREDD